MSNSCPLIVDEEVKPQVLPLAVAQRGLWVGQTVGPADAVFNLAEYTEIDGELDAELFIGALKQVASEVEATRIRVIPDATGLRQEFFPFYPGELPFFDWSGDPDAHDRALAWMNDELRRPVDMASDLLWRSALFRVAPDCHYWYHRAHHVAIDGFSGGLITRRVAELYSARVEGREPSPSGFLPLAALIEHEKEYRASSRLARDRSYWLKQLADLPEPISLSTRANDGRAGGLLRSGVRLSRAETHALHRLAERAEATVPQLLIGIWSIYLYRLTEADDLVFGMPVSARASREMRHIPGMIANAVAVRLRMSAQESLLDLLPQVSSTVRNALRHQQYRYEELRRDLGLIRQDQQISWVGVNIEPFDYDLRFGGLIGRTHNLSNGTVEDLTCFIYDRGDGHGLRIDLDANPALYTQAELGAHADRLYWLVLQLLRCPECPVGRIELLTEAERRRVLIEFNDTHSACPQIPWFRLFEEQAIRTPKALAVQAGDRQLSYAQLDAVANRCARVLTEQGVGIGDLVALALPRDLLMPIALLAVHKAGAAYLPLDCDAPAERLAYILDNAKPRLLLTTSDSCRGIDQDDLQVLMLDRLPLSTLPTRPLQIPVMLDSRAYVIYTSGSTGRPKGVEIPHQGLVNFLHAMRETVRPQADDRLLAVTTLAFDIATLELYLPLTVGACVILDRREYVRDPALLGQLIRDKSITLMQATPAHWQVLLAECPEALADLTVLTGGEALPPALAKRLVQSAHRVINLYGPTETTVWSTAIELGPEQVDNPPIGRPILNTQVYVLDRQLKPLPVGVVGDLYIAGLGVASGYLGRPGLSAERFLQNPFGRGRLYATGDRARWCEDGNLEFFGRSDFQIKIRGYRVEAGEIEAQLVDQEGVDQALVVLSERPAGGKVLVAYLTGKKVPAAEHLRRQLARRLPEYMVPGMFVGLERFPLNTNGKIDRRALPEPTWENSGGVHPGRGSIVPPRTPLEKQLWTLWRETLGIDRFGIHDGFFDLGGDSLTAVQMLSRLRDELGRDLPLAAIFDAATIAQLASRLQDVQYQDPLGPVLPLRSEGRGVPLFCIHPVVGLAWGYRALLPHMRNASPVYGIQAPGLRGGNLPGTLEEMAEMQLAELRELQPQGPYRLLGWSMGGLLAHRIAERLEQNGEIVSRLMLLDAYPYVQGDGAELDEASMVRGAIDFLGFDYASLDPAPRDMGSLTEFLCGQYRVESLPILDYLGDDRREVIERIRALIENHLRLARAFVPGKVRADMQFVRAGANLETGLNGLLHTAPDIWRPHVGWLHSHDLPCRHQQMLDAGPAAEVARLLEL